MTNVTDSTNSTATVRQKRVACLLPEMMPPEMANEADYEEGSEADVLSEEKDAAAVSKSVAEPGNFPPKYFFSKFDSKLHLPIFVSLQWLGRFPQNQKVTD